VNVADVSGLFTRQLGWLGVSRWESWRESRVAGLVEQYPGFRHGLSLCLRHCLLLDGLLMMLFVDLNEDVLRCSWTMIVLRY
jgi:hypothetical protein